MHRVVLYVTRYVGRCCGLAPLVISSLTAQRSIVPGVYVSSTGTIVNTQSQSTAAPNSSPNPERQMPIFLSGTVVIEGGAGPAADVAIQRVCSGAPRTIAFTNSKGHFNFQWGATSGIVQDASESGSGNGMHAADDMGTNGIRMGGGGLPGQSTQGCGLIANAPGFQPAWLDVSNHRGGDNPELGTIVLHRIAGVEGTSVSITALNAPRDAKKARMKGAELLHKSKTAEAEKQFEKAVEIYPSYANAWFDLGRARLRRQAEAPARDAFMKAIDADDKLTGPWLELGKLAVLHRNWPDAARYLDRALQLDPVDYPRLWYEDALADYHVRNFDRAERNVREALKVPLANRDPHADQLLGLLLMRKQDYAGADEALRAYLQLLPNAMDLDVVRGQIEEIDSHLAANRP
jgi:tetratricopeptide (TPR) repeat protein